MDGIYNNPTHEKHAARLDKVNGKYQSGQLQTVARVSAIVQAAYGKVLDLGCAGGIISVLMARKGCIVTGIDFLGEQVGNAEALKKQESPEVAERLAFMLGHAEQTELLPKHFNTVVLGQILEHVIYPRMVLVETARVLKPGGLVIITVPDGYNKFVNHIRWFTEDILKQLVSDYFAITNFQRIGKQMMIIATTR